MSYKNKPKTAQPVFSQACLHLYNFFKHIEKKEIIYILNRKLHIRMSVFIRSCTLRDNKSDTLNTMASFTAHAVYLFPFITNLRHGPSGKKIQLRVFFKTNSLQHLNIYRVFS